MPEHVESPTTAEWKILKEVAERGACAARDVVAATHERLGWSTSTVKTLLRRLVEKGLLKATRVGNSFLYEPTRAADSALREAADELLSNAGSAAVGPLLAYMVRRSDLSERDLQKLRDILEPRG